MTQTPFATARGDLMPIQPGDLPAPFTGVTSLGYPIDSSGASPPAGIPANQLISRAAPHSGYLTLASATLLQFAPFNGDLIKVNGFLFQIPGGGIAGLGNTGVFVDGVASQNLIANTTYFVYAFDNAGVVTADYSTTGHTTSGTANNVGVEVKSTDNSRTLIGMVRTNAGAQFVDTNISRTVVSWFNRRPKQINNGLGNATSTNVSAAYSNIYGSTAALLACIWADMPPQVGFQCQTQDSTNGQTGSVGLGIDSATAVQSNQFVFGFTGNTNAWYTTNVDFDSNPGEGFHTFTINAYGSATATASTLSVTNGTVYGHVWG